MSPLVVGLLAISQFCFLSLIFYPSSRQQNLQSIKNKKVLDVLLKEVKALNEEFSTEDISGKLLSVSQIICLFYISFLLVIWLIVLYIYIYIYYIAVCMLVYVVYYTKLYILDVFVAQLFYQYNKRQYNQLQISQYTILQAVITVP